MADFEEKFQALKEKHKDGIIVGLKEFGGVLPRRDIDVVMHDEPKMFNLLILALRELKRAPKDDIMGFFQISSIHGFPLTPWNHVPGKKPEPTVPGDGKPPASLDGYCPHGQHTFATWHRPYLVMLEQALFIQMIEIAKKYQNLSVRDAYLEAAKRFRLPYWDYHRPRGGKVIFPGIIDSGKETTFDYDFSVPRVFTQERIMAFTTPNNTLVMFRNPFFSFSFNDKNGDLRGLEWKFMADHMGTKLNSQYTHRHPYGSPDLDEANWDPQDIVWDNPHRLNTVLNELRMDANRTVLNMLSNGKDYSEFENFVTKGQNEKFRSKEAQSLATEAEEAEEAQKPEDPVKELVGQWSASVESIHDMYHFTTGGYPGPAGHMGRVPTAAFDPIFYFHHCQIERIFAIWQSLHDGKPNSWFKDSERAKEGLKPFIKEIKPTDGNLQVLTNVFWSSEDVKSCEVFGYTYGDIKSTPKATQEWVEESYRWSVPRQASLPHTKVTFGKPPPWMEPFDLSKSPFLNIPGPNPSPLLSDDLTLGDINFKQTFGLFGGYKDAPSSTEDVIPPELGEYWDWQIGDRVKRMALNCPYAVVYFVKNKIDGQLESGAQLYSTTQVAPSLAGLSYVFASPKEVCFSCARDAEEDRYVQSAVSITSQLMDYVYVGQLESLHPDHVVPFLKERLSWRIMDVNGHYRDTRTAPIGLELNVLAYKSDAEGNLRDVKEYPEVFHEIKAAADRTPSIELLAPSDFQTAASEPIDLWAGIEE